MRAPARPVGATEVSDAATTRGAPRRAGRRANHRRPGAEPGPQWRARARGAGPLATRARARPVGATEVSRPSREPEGRRHGGHAPLFSSPSTRFPAAPPGSSRPPGGPKPPFTVAMDPQRQLGASEHQIRRANETRQLTPLGRERHQQEPNKSKQLRLHVMSRMVGSTGPRTERVRDRAVDVLALCGRERGIEARGSLALNRSDAAIRSRAIPTRPAPPPAPPPARAGSSRCTPRIGQEPASPWPPAPGDHRTARRGRGR